MFDRAAPSNTLVISSARLVSVQFLKISKTSSNTVVEAMVTAITKRLNKEKVTLYYHRWCTFARGLN